MKIEVVIHAFEIWQLRSLELFEAFVLSRLRKAGIPVLGVFNCMGISAGTLTVMDDHASFAKRYIWRDQCN